MPKIRIYLDENISSVISEGLKRRGLDAFSAKDAILWAFQTSNS